MSELIQTFFNYLADIAVAIAKFIGFIENNKP